MSTRVYQQRARRPDAGLLRQWNHHGVDVSLPTNWKMWRTTVTPSAAFRRCAAVSDWGSQEVFYAQHPLILMRTLEFGGISYRMTREVQLI